MKMEGMSMERNDFAGFQEKIEQGGDDLSQIAHILKERDDAFLDPIFGNKGSATFEKGSVFFSEFSARQEMSVKDAQDLEKIVRDMLGTFDAFADWLYNPEIRDDIDNLERLGRVLDQTAEDLQALASSAEIVDGLQGAAVPLKRLVECMDDAKFQILEKKGAMLAI